MRYTQADGQRLYEEHIARAFADPKFQAIYEVEARKKELWLRRAEACLAAKRTRKKKAGT